MKVWKNLKYFVELNHMQFWDLTEYILFDILISESIVFYEYF